MTFFLALSADQGHVPFAHAGTGTINTLVLALLSFIADLKPETVIFAMEEPEIAVPPHTQRRIADYLLTKTTQAFVTSHSPFVIERFEPSQTLLLSRAEGMVTSKKVSEATGLKDNEFKRYARWGLSECMLGKAAIVVEGLTEFHALPVAARRMEENDDALQPLDIAGAAFFNSDGDGNGPKFGKFFKTLGLKTIAFYDHKANRPPEQAANYAASFDINSEHAHKGFEDLVSAEVPAQRLWTFLSELKASGEAGNVGIPAVKPDEAGIRATAKKALASNKGAGWAARLFEQCDFAELPATVTQFLVSVYGMFPAPPAIDDDEAAEPGAQGELPIAP
jgi:putative ATP-dependent endonuclease of OLD family